MSKEVVETHFGEMEKRKVGEARAEARVCRQEDYVKALEDDGFIGKTLKEQAREMGVTPMTVTLWRRTVNWEEIAARYRKMYGMFKPQIDMALIRNAMKGKEKSIELFYQRFEGWVAKSGLEVTVNKEWEGKTNKELMAEYVKGLTAEERNRVLGIGIGMGMVGADVEVKE